jgi:hypothetical protein
MEGETMTSRDNAVDRTYGHIDMATADDAPHVSIEYDLTTRFPNDLDIEVEQVWHFSQRMPVVIADTLDDEDWGIVLERLQKRDGEYLSPLEAIIFTAKINGFTPDAVRWKVGQTVAQNLYRRFTEKRIQQGVATGKLAWVAPTSMQPKVSDPHG